MSENDIFESKNFTAVEKIKQLIKDSPKVIDSVKGVAKEGKESQGRAFDIMDSVLEALRSELDKEETTEQRKIEIIELMNQIINKANDKDTEYKKWVLGLTALGLGVGAAAAIKSPTLRDGAVKVLKSVKPL